MKQTAAFDTELNSSQTQTALSDHANEVLSINKDIQSEVQPQEINQPAAL